MTKDYPVSARLSAQKLNQIAGDDGYRYEPTDDLDNEWGDENDEMKKTEAYKGYTINVDVDVEELPEGMNWEYWIVDQQGNLFTEGSFCKSKENAFTIAREIIDAEERMPGDIDYQPLSDFPDHQG